MTAPVDLSWVTVGTGVDCTYENPYIEGSTYTVRGEVFLDQTGPSDVWCVGADTLAVVVDGTLAPDVHLLSVRMADAADDERWNRAVEQVAEAIDGVERLDFAQYPRGSVALVELERVRDAIAELYRGDRP